MLKPRLVVTLTFQNGVLFRTKKFRPDYRYTTNYIDGGADEIFCIDVGGERAAFWRAVEQIADQTFVPIAVGGGIAALIIGIMVGKHHGGGTKSVSGRRRRRLY